MFRNVGSTAMVLSLVLGTSQQPKVCQSSYNASKQSLISANCLKASRRSRTGVCLSFPTCQLRRVAPQLPGLCVSSPVERHRRTSLHWSPDGIRRCVLPICIEWLPAVHSSLSLAMTSCRDECSCGSTTEEEARKEEESGSARS